MSLLPFIIDCDPWELQQYYPRRRTQHHSSQWNNFGLGITPSEIQLLSVLPSLIANDKNELANIRREKNSPQPIIGKDGFQVHMDVQQFKPNEISVKTTDNVVVIEGKHEDRQDEHGYIARHFVRKYKLPKGYDPNHVVSTLSSDGVLTIKAPPPAKSIEGNERVIQIQQTGPAHLNVKENKSEENQNGQPAEK